MSLVLKLSPPHKYIAVAQEFPCTIEGIGNVQTSWIGQRGVLEIQRKIVEEEAQSAIHTKSSELKLLARECLKAFEQAGLKNSELSQVQMAVNMCSSYVSSQKHPNRSLGKTSVSLIATLWKKQADTSTEMAP